VIDQFGRQNRRMYEASFRAQFLSGIIQPSIQVLSNLNYVVIAVMGGYWVASGRISLGDVVAFMQYSRQFTMPITQIAAQMNLLQSGLASAERVFEFLDAPEEQAERAAARGRDRGGNRPRPRGHRRDRRGATGRHRAGGRRHRAAGSAPVPRLQALIARVLALGPHEQVAPWWHGSESNTARARGSRSHGPRPLPANTDQLVPASSRLHDGCGGAGPNVTASPVLCPGLISVP
jgi:hypothetical protein